MRRADGWRLPLPRRGRGRRERLPFATDGRTDGDGGNHATGEALRGPEMTRRDPQTAQGAAFMADGKAERTAGA